MSGNPLALIGNPLAPIGLPTGAKGFPDSMHLQVYRITLDVALAPTALYL